ncbi:MAG: DUF481 domain-containing protein [Acidobacteriota bacterium]
MKNNSEKVMTIEGVIYRRNQFLCLELKTKSVLILVLGVMFAVFFSISPALGAEGEEGNRPDIVFLVNGDRISGEITKLQDGVIYITTELAGDVQVLWENVERLEGGTPLVFTLLDETVYRGSLGKESAESGTLTVNTPEGSILLDPSSLDVVGTTVKPPIDRFKGSVNFGLTLLKSNETRQLSFGTNGSYTGDSYYSEVSYNSFYTSNSSSESISKDYLSASSQRSLPRDWFFTGMFNAARNDGLNLDLRYNISGALGKDIIKNDTVTLQALAGLGFVSETYEGLDADTGSEAVFGLKLKAFELDSPKLSLTGEVLLYPRLGNFDRYRLETRAGLNLSLAKNIFLGLSFFDSYYNSPPFPGEVKNDYGLVSSLGVSF